MIAKANGPVATLAALGRAAFGGAFGLGRRRRLGRAFCRHRCRGGGGRAFDRGRGFRRLAAAGLAAAACRSGRGLGRRLFLGCNLGGLVLGRVLLQRVVAPRNLALDQGFDRIEGGTRANIGMRYTGTFDAGYTLRGVFGQSLLLDGKNSFATPDLVYAGADSGLETWRSDYVGAMGVELPSGLSLAVGGRLDEKSLDVRRSDVTVGYYSNWLQSEITYSQIAAQPLYGYPTDNNEIQTTSGIKFKENWTLYGSTTWDIDDNALTRRGIGIAYDDSCTVFALAFTQTRDIANESANDWQIGARISFRTLGDVKVGETSEPMVFGQTLVPTFQ